MLLSTCRTCGRPIRADDARCPRCQTLTKVPTPHVASQVTYWIVIAAVCCAVVLNIYLRSC